MGHPSLCKTWIIPCTVRRTICRHSTFKDIQVSLHILESTILITVAPIIQHLSSAPLQKHTSEARELRNVELLTSGQAAYHAIAVVPLVWNCPRKSRPCSQDTAPGLMSREDKSTNCVTGHVLKEHIKLCQ